MQVKTKQLSLNPEILMPKRFIDNILLNNEKKIKPSSLINNQNFAKNESTIIQAVKNKELNLLMRIENLDHQFQKLSNY